jgi:pimeloyl-ACP methyl ester carboxylesterase
MLGLVQRLVSLGWRRSGASLREASIGGSTVWYAEFPPLPARRGAWERLATRWHALEPAAVPPTIVLLHGLGASAASFHPVIPHLRRAYRVVIPDLPGYGASRPPHGRAFLPFGELVTVAQRFVARVAPRGAFLAGNSMGGWIATKIAARRPDLVRGLALLNPGGPALRAEDWVDFARVLMAEEQGVMDEWWRRTFHRPPMVTRLLSRDLRRIMKSPSVSELMANLQAEDFLSAEELAQVRCPAVLVWGERDRLIPDGCRSFYLQKLKGVRYEPVPDCGHCPQLECPARTADILVELAGTATGPSVLAVARGSRRSGTRTHRLGPALARAPRPRLA